MSAARLPKPTADDLRSRHLLPGLEAACLILLEHGVNPDNVPRTEDALTADGYLEVTGRIIDDATETARRPWPDRRVWRDLRPHLAEARRNLRDEL